ncbi:MAG: GNAT acetyltransferase [bacterium ADurb.Bin363]|nr:MAG: GNAT acetyltransferase [bacterium ADurb.Bin363]
MKKLDNIYYGDLINFIGEKPWNTNVIFLLKNKLCSIFTEEGDYSKGCLVVPQGELKDLYLLGEIKLDDLYHFLYKLEDKRTLLCDMRYRSLVMGTGIFKKGLKNVIYSYLEKPLCYEISITPTPKKLSLENKKDLQILPLDSSFIFKNFTDLDRFLSEGISYSIFIKKHIAAISNTYSFSEKYADICVYTGIAHRRKGYSYNCAKALINELLTLNKIPTWTTAEDHIPSRKLAEKLGMVVVDEVYCFY